MLTSRLKSALLGGGTKDGSMGETQDLAKYLSTLQFADLPTEVVETAKSCVTDTLGVGLVAADRAWSKMTADLVERSGGIAESTVWGRSELSTAQQAALANGTTAHGIEMDDRVPVAQEHPGCVAVPVALALGERAGLSGREFLTAVVAGYELGVRVGAAVKVKYPGIHPSGHKAVWVAVGSAAAALGLDMQQTLDAYGIAGSMAAGISEFSEDPRGTMIKRLHCGLAAHNGVLAGLLGQRGLTAPSSVLEGPYGYCNVFSAPDLTPKIDELTADLGTAFQIMNREIKPYAAWGGSHMAIDAIGQLLAQGPLDVDRVETIRVTGSRRLIDGHGLVRPSSIMSAQYSLPFLTATALARGAEALTNPVSLWTDETLTDPQITALAEKVVLGVDEDIERRAQAERHYGGAHVRVELADGTACEATVHHSKGTVQNPLSAAELEQKFLLLAGSGGRGAQAARLARAIADLEDNENVRSVGRIVREGWGAA